jgi:hypothetical protein
VISPSQGLYLHRTTQHRKTRTNIRGLKGIRSHDPSVQAQGPRGSCDQQMSDILTGISSGNFVKEESTSSTNRKTHRISIYRECISKLNSKIKKYQWIHLTELHPGFNMILFVIRHALSNSNIVCVRPIMTYKRRNV